MGLFLLNGKMMDEEDELFKSRISPEKAMRMLREKGMEVTLEQAAKILDFSDANVEIY